jgi:DNA-binding transcriptional ArsR family regulator
MVKYLDARLDATFGALADPTRRAILAQLALGETSVTQLAGKFDISLPGVVKHLRVLEDAKLLSTEKAGRVRRCRLVPENLRDASEWIAFYRQFWEEQLDSLARYFEETKTDSTRETKSWPPRNPPKGIRSNLRAHSPRRRNASSMHGRSRRS